MSKQKSELLNENFSTATAKLRKSILFNLIQQLGQDICYQCNLKIEHVRDLSIEHKEAWQRAENPIESFYSLDNIAFSHLSCNISAAFKPHKKYADLKEYRQAGWARHYAINKDEVLRKKRERYHRNK